MTNNVPRPATRTPSTARPAAAAWPFRGGARAASRVVLSPWGRFVLLGLFVAGAVCAVVVTGVDDVLDRRSGGVAPGVGAGVLCVGVYALAAFAFVPKSALTAAAGALFGIGPGLLVAVAGTMLGALLGFAVGCLLGRDALRPVLLRSGALTTLDQRLSGRAFVGVLVLRLLPILPFAAVNLGVALSRVRWSQFALATLVGTLPGNAAWVLAGASTVAPPSMGLWIPAAAGVALLGVVPAWRHLRNRRRIRLT
ncbi:TVP38/TMEM64 family protein [Streptomyces sp. 6N223]|uniref:TVP38/TMEM64 family protein n=1 Tax=Streptomyces sp. 6N223 TaxID=3457412 RepID=UPI003FD33C3B